MLETPTIAEYADSRRCLEHPMSAKVVMVPLDGSPESEVALPWAVLLAKRISGSVRLVGVHAPPAVLLDGETLVGSVIPDEPVRERETQYFAAVQTRFQGSGVVVAADLLDGSVIASLAEYARKLHPAWIVMLCHARGPVARFFVGETASEFVRESPCPVLLIHPADKQTEPVIRRVIIPLDGSPFAERMLGPASEFARAVGATVTLLKAGDASEVTYLDRQAQLLQAKGLEVKTQTAAGKSPADAIASEANHEPGTVVALATHCRGGISKLIWGSVADEVIRRTTGPVLVVNSKEA
jgi:nucleotide-binding universal stress UspA family protein